jgi:hypothetical protein
VSTSEAYCGCKHAQYKLAKWLTQITKAVAKGCDCCRYLDMCQFQDQAQRQEVLLLWTDEQSGDGKKLASSMMWLEFLVCHNATQEQATVCS